MSLKTLRTALKDAFVEAACAVAVLRLDRRLRTAADLDRDPPERILVIRTDRIGDLMCCSPLIAALHERWPGASITLVGGPGNRAAMPLFPFLLRAPVELARGPLSRLRLRSWLSRERFDQLVDAAYRPEGTAA